MTVRRNRASDRLRRLLLVVPYIVKNPGVDLSEVASRFDVDPEDLVSDLNVLLVSGLPPYGPGDLIDVDIEGGSVWIDMADYFARPLALTRDEAVALHLTGTALLGTPGFEKADALRSAMEKLAGALPDAGLAGAVQPADADRPVGALEIVRRAVNERLRLRIDYYSAARDEVTTREIDPEHVFTAIGHWYVVAWCHRVDGERLFRTDRIRAAEPTGERFEPRGLVGAGRPLYSGSAQDLQVRLRLAPEARWVAEYYEVDEVREVRGGLEVRLPTTDLAGVAKLLLRLGDRAEVLDPPELRETARRAAEAALALYDGA